MGEQPAASTIVIFGAPGDLAQRKLRLHCTAWRVTVCCPVGCTSWALPGRRTPMRASVSICTRARGSRTA